MLGKIFLKQEQDWSKPMGIKDINSEVANKKDIIILQVKNNGKLDQDDSDLVRNGDILDIF